MSSSPEKIVYFHSITNGQGNPIAWKVSEDGKKATFARFAVKIASSSKSLDEKTTTPRTTAIGEWQYSSNCKDFVNEIDSEIVLDYAKIVISFDPHQVSNRARSTPRRSIEEDKITQREPSIEFMEKLRQFVPPKPERPHRLPPVVQAKPKRSGSQLAKLDKAKTNFIQNRLSFRLLATILFDQSLNGSSIVYLKPDPRIEPIRDTSIVENRQKEYELLKSSPVYFTDTKLTRLNIIRQLSESSFYYRYLIESIEEFYNFILLIVKYSNDTATKVSYDLFEMIEVSVEQAMSLSDREKHLFAVHTAHKQHLTRTAKSFNNIDSQAGLVLFNYFTPCPGIKPCFAKLFNLLTRTIIEQGLFSRYQQLLATVIERRQALIECHFALTNSGEQIDHQQFVKLSTIVKITQIKPEKVKPCTRQIIDRIKLYRSSRALQSTVLPTIDANYNNGRGVKDEDIYLNSHGKLFKLLSDKLTELTPRRHSKSSKPPKEKDIIELIATNIVNYIDNNYPKQQASAASSMRRSQSTTIFQLAPSPRTTSSTSTTPRSATPRSPRTPR